MGERRSNGGAIGVSRSAAGAAAAGPRGSTAPPAHSPAPHHLGGLLRPNASQSARLLSVQPRALTHAGHLQGRSALGSQAWSSGQTLGNQPPSRLAGVDRQAAGKAGRRRAPRGGGSCSRCARHPPTPAFRALHNRIGRAPWVTSALAAASRPITLAVPFSDRVPGRPYRTPPCPAPHMRPPSPARARAPAPLLQARPPPPGTPAPQGCARPRVTVTPTGQPEPEGR